MVETWNILRWGVGALLALPLLALLLGGGVSSLALRIAAVFERINQTVGRAVAWLSLFMVLTMFAIVVMRYIYGFGLIWIQESVMYMHGFLFMLGAGFTLLQDGHVRVDIVYREATPRFKAWVNFLGTYVLLFPVMLLVLEVSMPYVQSSWAVFEGSKETSGIHGVYLLKTAILIFAGLLLAQGFVLAARAQQTLRRGDPATADLTDLTDPA